jgi:hypothetical protein
MVFIMTIKSDFPIIDLKKLAVEKKKNFEQRLKFIDFYVDYLKKAPNKKWSK